MKHSNNIISINTYNIVKDKYLIYKDNINKWGIYSWNNIYNKSYVNQVLI